jgi:polysaccharide chain length determinant protein (PEP-CTERM system associated)
MQATLPNEIAVVRRTLDVEDYLDIVRRQKGWLIGPLLAGVVIACVAAFLWPDTYVSSASIRVVPPQVPERLVPTNVSTQMADRINSMAQTILSRNTLTNIIQTHDLYRKERAGLPLADIIERMLKDIRISPLTTMQAGSSGRRETQAFSIAYSYENRYLAQKVTRDLMSRFIDENIRERSSQSQLTTQFLREQLEQAKVELDAIESRVTGFRVQNTGRLPEQLLSNVHAVNTLESRVTTLNASVARANQEKLLLDAELRQVRERIGALMRPSSEGGTLARGRPVDEDLLRVEREIQQLEQAIARMLETYKPTYPDVVRLEERLTAARKQRDRLFDKQMAIPDGNSNGQPAAVPMDPARLKELADLEASANRLQIQIRAKEMEAENLIRQITDADRKMQDIQFRIESGPIGEQQYEQLIRDREMAKQRYDDLNRKLAQSAIATDLESRKQGETLEVLDLPSLPEAPSAPNRPMIVGLGAVLGLVAGCFVVGLREISDTSLKSLKDVTAYTGLGILGSVPLLENDRVVRRRRQIAWLGWSVGLALSATAVAGSIWYYYSSKL